MGKCFSYLVMLLLLMSSLPARAQDDEIWYDSVQQEEIEELTEGYGTYFNPKEQEEKIEERSIEEEKILAIKKEEDYWYADLHPDKKEPEPEPEQNTLLQSDFFKTIFWILLTGGFVALLIWFLASGNISLFGRKGKVYETQNELAAEDEDIFALPYEKEIQKAIKEGNFRLATRLLYLQVLKEMAERNIIKYSHEKTNSDYLFQLSKSRYYKNFFTLTRHFEYSWYGGFAISPENFQQVQKDFSSFKQQLG